MASEEVDDGAVSFAVAPDVGDWLEEVATRRGETRAEFSRTLLEAAHAASTDAAFDPIDRSDVDALRDRLADQRSEFVDHVEDVRERVLQVKREVDRTPPADHDHDEYARTAEVETLREALDALERSTTAGFENYEAVLEEVLDDRDVLAARSETLARAVLDLRAEREQLLARERRREAVDRLREAANSLDVERATCTHCSGAVTIALLTRPTCPHCDQPLSDVERRSSRLRSHRLVAGEHPALEGGTASEADALAAALEPIPERDSDSETGVEPGESDERDEPGTDANDEAGRDR